MRAYVGGAGDVLRNADMREAEAEAEEDEVYRNCQPPVADLSHRPRDPRTKAGWNILSRLLFT